MSTHRELKAYQQAAVQDAAPVDIVIALYDLLVRDLRQIIAAIRARDIEERVKQSNHAFLVLAHAEDLLDVENGGATAVRLARVYSHLRAKLLEAQLTQDVAVLETQMELLLQLRQGWQQAKTGAASLPELHAAPQAALPNANSYANFVPELNRSGWSA